MGVYNKNNALLILIALAVVNTGCFAQEVAQRQGGRQILYRERPYENITTTSWRDSLYRFDQFQEGRVRFINGFSKNYKLNYSLASGEMEFIDASGDSLVLDGTADLRLVNVGGNIFFHHPKVGYIELLLQMPIALGVKRFLGVERKEVVGDNGYGQQTFTTSAVSSFYRTSPSAFSNYDILYEKVNQYFFIDGRNVPRVANRYSLLKLFPDHRVELKQYLRRNRVNFRREGDMLNLTNYIARFY